MSWFDAEMFGETDTMQHETDYCHIEGEAIEDIICDLEQSNFSVVCFGTVGISWAHILHPE
jgi:hypothetical protein